MASALSGKPNVEPYGTPDFPVDDPYATAKRLRRYRSFS